MLLQLIDMFVKEVKICCDFLVMLLSTYQIACHNRRAIVKLPIEFICRKITQFLDGLSQPIREERKKPKSIEVLMEERKEEGRGKV